MNLRLSLPDAQKRANSLRSALRKLSGQKIKTTQCQHILALLYDSKNWQTLLAGIRKKQFHEIQITENNLVTKNQNLSKALADLGCQASGSQVQQLAAKIFGFKNWETLHAATGSEGPVRPPVRFPVETIYTSGPYFLVKRDITCPHCREQTPAALLYLLQWCAIESIDTMPEHITVQNEMNGPILIANAQDLPLNFTEYLFKRHSFLCLSSNGHLVNQCLHCGATNTKGLHDREGDPFAPNSKNGADALSFIKLDIPGPFSFHGHLVPLTTKFYGRVMDDNSHRCRLCNKDLKTIGPWVVTRFPGNWWICEECYDKRDPSEAAWFISGREANFLDHGPFFCEECNCDMTRHPTKVNIQEDSCFLCEKCAAKKGYIPK